MPRYEGDGIIQVEHHVGPETSWEALHNDLELTKQNDPNLNFEPNQWLTFIGPDGCDVKVTLAQLQSIVKET